MGELRSLLDALSAEDLSVLPAGPTMDRVVLLVAVVNQANAELTRTVRHAEVIQAPEHDGLKSMRSWLIGHARLAPADASRIVRSGRVLEHFPAIAAGFAAGSITAAQVNVVAEKVGPGERAAAAEQGIDLAPFDQAWATVAKESPHQSLAVAVQAFDDALDPDGTEPDPTEERSFTMSQHADGSGSGRFDLDAVGFEKSKDHPLPTTRKLAAGPWGWPFHGPAAGTRRELASGGGQSGPFAAHAAHHEAAGDRRPGRRGLRRPGHRSWDGADRVRRPDLCRTGPLAGV